MGAQKGPLIIIGDRRDCQRSLSRARNIESEDEDRVEIKDVVVRESLKQEGLEVTGKEVRQLWGSLRSAREKTIRPGINRSLKNSISVEDGGEAPDRHCLGRDEEAWEKSEASSAAEGICGVAHSSVIQSRKFKKEEDWKGLSAGGVKKGLVFF